ncbi:hypothetical protein RND81_01G084800 [Saponaria officinalis]|uniref:Uncharacterized protein n=1 Tax=Saponaria officinalis TaxID=3572 RepID=A0AAW1NHB1_SAPOF
MDDLDSTNFDDDTKGFSLINVSASDDDFLFVSSSEANSVDNEGDIFAKEAHMDQPSELLAVQRPKKPGKCNMRKSLAWDSAFFTSAGVLDAEELSSIMEGSGAGLNQNHQLPGIQEELSKSSDSITTFESDNLTLESLEADLFCDIRASIQRSSKTSNSANNNEKGESVNGSCKKIFQSSSGNMVKTKLASRKPIPTVQGPVRMLKPTSISKQVTKPVVSKRELSSTWPQSPAATSTSSLEEIATNKRTSVGASCTQSEINRGGIVEGVGKEALISKGPRRVDSRNTLQKSLASSKLPSASSVFNRTAIRGSLSSFDSSSSSSTTTKSYLQNEFSSNSSTEKIRKSPSDVRRKIDKNANLPPGSKIRTPSRLSVKSKSRPGDSQLSAYVKSTSNLSASVSPASSISEWSTESSSSTATVNQKLSGSKYGSAQDVIADCNMSQNMPKDSNNRSLGLGRHDHLSAGMLSQSTKQPSTGPAASLARPSSAKPSGLRLPSPKIGFFDGAKSGTKTPSGSARYRSALPSNISKSAGGNHSHPERANNAIPGNIAVKVSTSAARTAKPDRQKSLASPKLTRQHQDQSVNLQSQNGSGTFSEVSKTTLPKPPLERISIVAKTVVEGEDVAVSGTYAKNNSTGMQKSVVSMILFDGSETYIERPEISSIDSDLEGSSEVSDEFGREHISDVSFTAKDHPEVVLKTSSVRPFDGESEANSELLRCHSPETGRDSKVAEVTKGGKVLDDLRDPNLFKEVQDPSADLQSGNDSGIFSEVSKTTLPKFPLKRISLAAEGVNGGEHVAVSNFDAKNHEKAPVLMVVNDGFDTSIEIPESKSFYSAFERKSEISRGMDEGNYTAEVSFLSKKQSETVLKTSTVATFNDILETNSLLLERSSPEIERISNVAGASEGGVNLDDEGNPTLTKEPKDGSVDLQSGDDSAAFSEVSNTTLAKSALDRVSMNAEAANEDKHVAALGPDAKNLLTVLQKVSVPIIVNDGSDTSIELPKSTSTNSALERKNEVSEEGYGGKYVSEVSFIAKNSEMLPKTSSVLNIDDDPDSNSELLGCLSPEIGRDSKVTEEVIQRGENPDDLQRAPISVFVNDGLDTAFEFPRSTSSSSALEINSEVSEKADGGNNVAEVSIVAKNHSEMVLKTSTVPTFDEEPETNSQLLRCSSPKIVRHSNVPDAKHGVEHSDYCGSAFKDDFVAVKEKASEARKLESTINQRTEFVGGMAVSQGSRTSFAEENFVSVVVEASNSSLMSASEAFAGKSQTENS